MKTFKYITVLACLSPLFSAAQWDTVTTNNTPVAVASKSQSGVHMVTDGNGGAIITWEDNKNSGTNSTDIYAQRIDKNGYAKWALNGIAVCSNTALQNAVNIVESDNGSAILTWEDSRSGNIDIYAQKIDSTGVALWTTNGVVISNKTTTQRSPKIISDDLGGAIIVWEDSVNGSFDVSAQKINSSGVVQWTANGIVVCNATNQQINPKLDTDGANGGIITWQDKRNGIDYNIYAQRVKANGTFAWTNNGITICNSAGTQSNPRIEPDGNAGAIIAWVDKRNGLDYDVYAQRIDSTGAVKWSNNGTLVCNAQANQSAIDLKYLGNNGVIVSWKDFRNGTNQIYAQLLNLQGVSQMTSNGTKLSNSLQAINSNAIANGKGDAIIVWQDSVVGGWNIKSQKISSNGVLQWGSGGKTICDAVDDQINADNVSDGNNGVIYAWEDRRNTKDYDIYAHHISDTSAIIISGVLDEMEENSRVNCYPNPVTDATQFVYLVSKNELVQTVTIYNSASQLVAVKSTDNKGVCTVDANLFVSGIYYFSFQLKNDSGAENGTFMVIK